MTGNTRDAALLRTYEYLDGLRARLPSAEFELLLRTLCRIGDAGGGEGPGPMDITPAEADRQHFTPDVQKAVVTSWEMLEPAVDYDRSRLRAIVEGLKVELERADRDAVSLDGILRASES